MLLAADSAIIYTDIMAAVQTLVYIIGGAVALLGVIDALSGYSNQSSGKMSEGIIKAVGGAGIVAIGASLIPKIFAGLG
ncbi:MAG: Maff2 family protein [Bacillus sp. (in: Bacteria)]|nr:Maff2 family protein [Bacillus sp. (in: firmicutes)]MCM1427851.1 Maff2 family protein [Eubacterium sp.]